MDNLKALKRKVSIRQKIKKAFLSTGKDISIVACGKEYKIRQERIDGSWKGILYNDETPEIIIDKELVENLINEDESILD